MGETPSHSDITEESDSLQMESETHYEHIIGGTEEEKEVALNELQKFFDEKYEKLSKYELEKTPEDSEIIQKTESVVDRMVKKYGGNPKLIPLNHIYILKPGSVLAMTKGKLAGGIHKPLGVKIGVEKGESNLLFASTIAHELFHLKSYKSARIGKSPEDVRLYRSGISMIDRKNPDAKRGEEKGYFEILEEAIVAECTRKFLDEISKDNLFKEDSEAMARFKDWVIAYYIRMGVSAEKVEMISKEVKYIPNPQEKVKTALVAHEDEIGRQAFAAGTLQGLHDIGKVETLERYGEREMLYKLLDEIVAKSDGRFEGRDLIFDEFAKANFSGNYLPLARIVEDILGEGSFRKIAEQFSEEPKKKGAEGESSK